MSYVICRYAPCSNVFWARNKVHYFCCRKCQQRARGRRQRITPFERKCRNPGCERLFIPYRMQVYCCKKCKNRHARDLNRDQRNQWRRDHYAKNRKQISEKRRQNRRSARVRGQR